MGICRARQGGWTQAAAAFERAVMCLPRHPVLLHELAKAFQVPSRGSAHAMGELVASRGRVGGGRHPRAWRLDPDHPDRAALCRSQAIGDHRAAVERFTQVLALQPGNARALFRRGLSHHALKAYESAAADLEAAKRLDPDNVALRVDYRTLRELRTLRSGVLPARRDLAPGAHPVRVVPLLLVARAQT